MMFRPFGVCTKEPHLEDAVAAFNANECPHKKTGQMTEAEIMKALEEISHNENLKQYSGIPMVAECTLDLINRKNAENEQFADIGKMYSEIKAEARAEAIKEFAERVKEICTVPNDRWIPTNWVSAEIDQIAKEMGVKL